MPEMITAKTLENMFGNLRLMQQLAFILEVEKPKTFYGRRHFLIALVLRTTPRTPGNWR